MVQFQLMYLCRLDHSTTALQCVGQIYKYSFDLLLDLQSGCVTRVFFSSNVKVYTGCGIHLMISHSYIARSLCLKQVSDDLVHLSV